VVEAERAMLDAAMMGDVAAVQGLLEDRPDLAVAEACDRCAGGPYTALFLAAEAGHAEVVRLLTEHGADPNSDNTPQHWTPLLIALAYGHDRVACYLLAHGARRDIFAAAALGDQAAVEALAATDPGLVRAKGPDGAEPLHFARTVALAQWLLDHGADPRARDEIHENTPARWAAADSRRQDVARLLAKFDAETDIFLACALGETERVRDLLEVFPALANSRGRPRDLLGSGTPLHVAAERGQADVAELLLSYGADPNARSAYGHFPLHSAAMRGQIAVVECLLAYGARPDVRDRGQQATPSAWARRFGHQAIAVLLERQERLLDGEPGT